MAGNLFLVVDLKGNPNTSQANGRFVEALVSVSHAAESIAEILACIFTAINLHTGGELCGV